MWVAYASIWGFVFTVLALMLGAMLIRNRNVNARRLDQRLSRWEGKYELTKEQIARIREIEVGFHGRSNLIWTARRTAEEMQRHNAEIAAKMSAPAAERL